MTRATRDPQRPGTPAAVGARGPDRTAPPEAALPVRATTRALGAQYLVGGAIVLMWSLLPQTSPLSGAGVVTLLAVLALLLGGLMTGLAALPLRDPALHRANHLCISTAQLVIAAGVAATGAAASPLLLFLLWTTPYAGVFSRRARRAHLAWTLLVLVLAVSAVVVRGADPVAAAVGATLVGATIVVVTALVARVTDALHRQAATDPLTGLPNRRAFTAAVTRALDEGRPLAVLLLDLDRFKHVNDTWGHHAGDALLLGLAPRLRRLVRRGELVARLGGDEFAVLLSTADEQQALAAARRLALAWSTPLPLEHGDVLITGSTGVSVAEPGDTADSLLREADAAMYLAKERGDGEPQCYEPSLQRASARRLALETDLRRALRDDALDVLYQPVVDAGGGAPRVVAVEALARWRHPQLGDVPPSEFVPLAEATGTIGALGAAVAERAAADLARWRRRGVVPDALRVAVNVSPAQLDDRLAPFVAGLLERHLLPARCVAVEVTESALATGPVAERALRDLRDLGVALLLDDFGTGHSSLAQLRRLPVDALKVDRAFVRDLERSPQDRGVVRAVLSMAEALELGVVAEGVESAGQRDVLHALGCTTTQGWLHAPAVPADALPRLLRVLQGDDPPPDGAGLLEPAAEA